MIKLEKYRIDSTTNQMQLIEPQTGSLYLLEVRDLNGTLYALRVGINPDTKKIIPIKFKVPLSSYDVDLSSLGHSYIETVARSIFRQSKTIAA